MPQPPLSVTVVSPLLYFFLFCAPPLRCRARSSAWWLAGAQAHDSPTWPTRHDAARSLGRRGCSWCLARRTARRPAHHSPGARLSAACGPRPGAQPRRVPWRGLRASGWRGTARPVRPAWPCARVPGKPAARPCVPLVATSLTPARLSMPQRSPRLGKCVRLAEFFCLPRHSRLP
jgi:hypothetical protein